MLITSLFSAFPKIPMAIYNISGLTRLLEVVNALLPNGYFPVWVSTVLFFKSFSLVWALIEWLYKKIPGVS